MTVGEQDDGDMTVGLDPGDFITCRGGGSVPNPNPDTSEFRVKVRPLYF